MRKETFGVPDSCILEGSWTNIASLKGVPMPTSMASTVSALTLFPGWEELGPWYRAEVHGLTEAQLDFAAPPPAPEWLWWSIRRHTRDRKSTRLNSSHLGISYAV